MSLAWDGTLVAAQASQAAVIVKPSNAPMVSFSSLFAAYLCSETKSMSKKFKSELPQKTIVITFMTQIQ